MKDKLAQQQEKDQRLQEKLAKKQAKESNREEKKLQKQRQRELKESEKQAVADRKQLLKANLSLQQQIDVLASRQELKRQWYKLDNAALIYPALNVGGKDAIFRLSVLLKKEVNPLVLQQAINDVVPRFPTITTSMRAGVFWYYFDSPAFPIKAEIQDKHPATPIAVSRRRPIVRVCYFKNEIACEFFHSACDGSGGLAFLNCLVARYLTLLGEKIEDTTNCLNVFDKPSEKETEDSFQRVFDKNAPMLFKEERAYHTKGTQLPGEKLVYRKLICSASQLHSIAKQFNCTITILLSALLLLAFKHEKDFHHSKDNNPIKLSVPINLRKFYDSQTVRNFSSYLYATYVESDNLQDLINELKVQWEKQNNKAYCDGMISYNCRSQNNIFIKLTPLVLKNIVLGAVYKAKGDARNTASFSNLGIVKAPKEFAEHIHRYEFNFGKTFSTPIGMTAVTFGDCLVINLSSQIRETVVERHFVEQLSKLGAKMAVECNDVESYTIKREVNK
ncbi:MAG: hypothetical protein J6R37_02760 [Clostridia bacterium]|nr:hypothetical protein [Clostridia bacterium]